VLSDHWRLCIIKVGLFTLLSPLDSLFASSIYRFWCCKRGSPSLRSSSLRVPANVVITVSCICAHVFCLDISLVYLDRKKRKEKRDGKVGTRPCSLLVHFLLFSRSKEGLVCPHVFLPQFERGGGAKRQGRVRTSAVDLRHLLPFSSICFCFQIVMCSSAFVCVSSCSFLDSLTGEPIPRGTLCSVLCASLNEFVCGGIRIFPSFFPLFLLGSFVLPRFVCFISFLEQRRPPPSVASFLSDRLLLKGKRQKK